MATEWFIVIICVIQITATTNQYICNEPASCNELNINTSNSAFDPFGDLALYCNGTQSCSQLTINALSVASTTNSSNTITVECNGKQSCLSSTLTINDYHSLSLGCKAPDSCIDTHIYAPNASDIVINLYDSCTSMISIECLKNPSSVCYIYCDNKYLSILSTAFKIVSIVSANHCINQKFVASYSQSEDSIYTRDCVQLNSDDKFYNMLRRVVWDIKHHNYLKKASYDVKLIPSDNESNATCVDSKCLMDINVIDASASSMFTMDCAWRGSRCYIQNVTILCPQIFDLSVAAEHNYVNCLIKCIYGECNNLSIFVPKDGSLTVYCGYRCSGIIINAGYAQRIVIYCEECQELLIHAAHAVALYLFSLRNSTVHAEYSRKVSLDCVEGNSYRNVDLYVNHSQYVNIKCQQQYYSGHFGDNTTAGCESLNIFANNAHYINMIADGKYAVHSVSLYAQYADIVNVEGFERNSLIASTVVATNANFFNLSCFGGYGTFSCAHSSFYVSSNQSVINCQGFGCVNITLFIDDNIDKYQLIINGCNQCHSLEECTNHWNIVSLKNINTTFIDDDEDCKFPILEATLAPYIIDYSTSSYRNHVVNAISITLSCIYGLSLFIMFAVMIFELIKYVIKKYNNRYISKRPYDILLWAPFLCEILIFVGMFWWRFKTAVFYHETVEYCSTTYVGYNTVNGTLVECDNDPMCCMHSIWYYCEDWDLKSDDCECVPIKSHTECHITWWVFFGVFALIELMRCIASWCHDYINGDYDVNHGPFHYNYCTGLCVYWASKMCSIHCAFCKYLIKVHISSVWRQTFYEELFWKRILWRIPFKRSKWILFYYGCDMISRYSVHIVFVSVYWIKYSSIVNVADSGIKWYDIVPVLILLCLKTVFQYYYVRGNEYDLRCDWPHVIDEILKDKYGDRISWIIKFYLPIFHDDKLCELSLLITEEIISRSSNGDKNRDKAPSFITMASRSRSESYSINSQELSLQIRDENRKSVLLQTQTESNTEEKVNDSNPLVDDYEPPVLD